jgi:hypothetical protein
VYLHSNETYFPGDLEAFLRNTDPTANFTISRDGRATLNNLNRWGPEYYLTSAVDVTRNPRWLKGRIPDQNGKTIGTIAVVIVNGKGNGVVDAFYFYFYAFNYGIHGYVSGDYHNYGRCCGTESHDD